MVMIIRHVNESGAWDFARIRFGNVNFMVKCLGPVIPNISHGFSGAFCFNGNDDYLDREEFLDYEDRLNHKGPVKKTIGYTSLIS